MSIAAQYSGDAAFSPGGAATTIQVTLPTLAAAIIPSAPITVWPSPPDAQGLSWQTAISLREIGGVPALVHRLHNRRTDADAGAVFSVDGDSGEWNTVTLNLVFRNLAPPLTRTFGFTGVDPTGQSVVAAGGGELFRAADV